MATSPTLIIPPTQTTPTDFISAAAAITQANTLLQLANTTLQNADPTDPIATATAVANYDLANASLNQAVSNFDALSQSLNESVAQMVANSKTAGLDISHIVATTTPQKCETTDQFQGIRFYDGTSFGYLRVYKDKVQLLLDKPFEFSLDGTMLHTYRLTGQGDNIRLYVDGLLAIDASGNFDQPTSSKIIEFGDIAGRDQNIFSSWDSFKYTTTGAFPPSNNQDLILEEQISFPQSSVGRLKTYDEGLYASVDPANQSLSSSIYRFDEGYLPEHRPVLAITKSDVSAVVIDQVRSASLFGATGKFLGTQSGLQYVIGSKPDPFDFVTDFSQPLDGNGWTLNSNCLASCESLNNGVLSIDTRSEVTPVLDKYSQDEVSDPWVANADNATGWTVEVRVKILDDGSGGTVDAISSAISGDGSIQCGITDNPPDPTEDNLFAPGIYINDGTYQEFFQFFQKGIRMKYAHVFGNQTLTDQFYTVRIIGKNKNVAIFAKGDSDQNFNPVLYAADSLSVKAHNLRSQSSPVIFSDKAGIVHAVWQEDAKEQTVISYSRLNRPTVAHGSGVVGTNSFDPNNSLLQTRVGFGLSPAAILNYKQLPSNVIIAQDASFRTNGVKIGDFIQIFDQQSNPRFQTSNGVTTEIPTTVGTPRQYKIKDVIDDVLLELDTTDNLANIGPSSWQVVSGDLFWSPTVQVSNNAADSENPRILYHSNGSIFVAYNNDQNGNDEIFVRKGSFSANGISWGDLVQVTSSTNNALTPDIAELQDGRVIVVWQDATNDTTGSQIFYAVLKNLPPRKQEQTEVELKSNGFSSLTVDVAPTTLTPNAAHARHPKVASDKAGSVVLLYEDDVDGVFEIYSAAINNLTGAVTPVLPVKISTNGLALNPSIVQFNGLFFAAWETYAFGKSEIVSATLLDFQNQVWSLTRYTSSRGNSRHPSVGIDKFGAAVAIYESDRTRDGFFELYCSKLGVLRIPDGLSFTSPTLSGTPTTPGLYRIQLATSNGVGTAQAELVLTVIASGSPSFGPNGTPPVTDTPFITSPLIATAVVGQAFSYTITAINNPTAFNVSRGQYISSAGVGLDVKIKSYLTQNTNPCVATLPNGNIAIVWEGTKDANLQTIFATEYDTFSSTADETVLAYFPLDEQIGTVVHNRILPFDVMGFLGEQELTIPRNGTAFHSVDVYSTTPVLPGESLFNTNDERAFDLGNFGGDGKRGGFSIATDPYIMTSGAIDMYVKPHWPSSDISPHIFFGNGPLNTTTPNTMVFGIGPQFVGNAMRFRIVDSIGTVHETVINNPSLWAAEDAVHFRTVWDTNNIGISSILGISFSSTTIGYACGANGAIFKTTDGGNTWTLQPTGITYDLYSIDFINNTTGFACGELGTVLFTTNGGTNWTVIDSGTTEDLTSIFFTTTSIGYACGTNGTILKSTNGGISWASVTFATAPANDFTSIALMGDGTTLVAVGVAGQMYISTDGITFTAVANLPKTADWNAISRTHQVGPFTTYVVGSSGSILKTTNNGTTWTDISIVGPDTIVPNLLCVSSIGTNVLIPWGTDKFAYSTNSGTSFSFVTLSLSGPYHAVEANFNGGGSGSAAVIAGAGGRLLVTANLGGNQTLTQTRCANMTIYINGKEVDQTRSGDCSFTWNPAGQTLFFGDYQQNGTNPINAAVDEIVIYNVPTPNFSAHNRHEFRTFQTTVTAIVPDSTGKKIEWGNVSALIKSASQWERFDMFFCGAKEPLFEFAWNVETGLVNDIVTDLAFDLNGNLWIATDNGISLLNLNKASASIDAFLLGRAQPAFTGLFTNYTGIANNLISDSITSITVDENNNVWAGTTEGLMVLQNNSVLSSSFSDPTTQSTISNTNTTVQNSQFVTYTTSNGLPSNNILTVRSVRGAVLVGTDMGLAVVITAPVTQADTTAAANAPTSTSTSTSNSQSIQTAAGTITISVGGSSAATSTASTDTTTNQTAQTGLTPLTLQSVTVYTTMDQFPSNRIQAIAQETGGNIWIGTDKGLVLFRPSKSIVYNTSNGLLSRDILSIAIDGRNRKFLGTDFGMTILDGAKFIQFPPSSGIGPGSINGAAADLTGTIWFASGNGLVEFNENCPEGPRFTTYGIQDGIIGEERIVDYLRYRILGGPIPHGSCNKALVKVAVNGTELSNGFTVDPSVPWIIFDKPLSASDDVDVCLHAGWRKVQDFNFDRKNHKVNQATVDTVRSNYALYQKRLPAGLVSLGGNFASGAANLSTQQYSVFAVPLPGFTGPAITSVSSPTSAVYLTTVSVGDLFYSDSIETITGLPQELITAEHILLASADAANISSDYLDFTLGVDSIVYVAYDSRATSIPGWLRDFDPVPVLFRVTDMEVFTDATEHEKLFVSTSGTNGCVYDILHDPTICDISAEIASDVTPPSGCATITKVNSTTSFTLSLSATDAVTGVTDMQIAPRSDGTSDGTTPVDFIPFQSNFVFSLPPSASATTGQIGSLPPDTLAGGTEGPLPPNIINNVFHNFNGSLLVGTKNPGRVYKFDQTTNLFSLVFDTGEQEVDSMVTFGKVLIVGTGTNGKAFSWDGTSLTQLPLAISQRVSALWIFANKVYLGYSPGGEIYTYDQFGMMQLFMNTFETAITGFATFGSQLYWSTANEAVSAGDQLVTTTTKGHKHFITVPNGVTLLSQLNGTTSPGPDGHIHLVVNGIVQPAENHIHGLNGSRSGKIFRFDPGTGQPIIVHADTDYDVSAIASTSEDSSGILFAGTSPHGKVLRFIPEEAVFIKSFQTPNLTVNQLRFFNKMYALVDNVVYTFTGQHWEFVAATADTVHDIAPDVNTGSSDNIIILGNTSIASTSAAPTALNPRVCAFVRFRDAAGNISSLVDSSGNLVPCYNPCFDPTAGITGSGVSGISGVSGASGALGPQAGKSRLLKIDEDAKIIFALDGAEPFYSGDQVEQEVGIYYSEIFNGTNSFVQWVNLTWDATVPAGASVTIAVRSAGTHNAVSSAIWGNEFTDPAGNDITNVTGQFLQFRATLTVSQQGIASPILHAVDIVLRTSQAVHYFTTNFTLPDNFLKGILTYNGCVNPPVTDVVFGVTGLDSTDFSDYYVISPDKLFDVPPEHQTKNLRVGIKLISSPTQVPVVDEFALMFSLANDAIIRLNLLGQPISTSGQLAPVTGSRTVITEKVQGHSHTITFDATILNQTNINGSTSINAGHQHTIINGVVQQAAGHTHNFSI